MVQELYPILITPDIERALGFYRDLLGFEVTYRFPDDGSPHYIGLELGSSQLGIGGAPDGQGAAGRATASGDGDGDRRFALWAYVEDCDGAVERLRSAGVAIVEEPQDQPWGERVATVADPDGNRVIIGAR